MKSNRQTDDGLLLVGNPGIVHVGAHLSNGAKQLGLRNQLYNVNDAFNAPWWLNKFNWWLREHYPTHLKEFSQRLIEACKECRPRWLVATGLAPIEAQALKEMGVLDVIRINYLTDDPWNPAHRASWFMKALPLYDYLFSPRSANLEDLRKIGGPNVSYLPFAYAPELHFPEPPDAPEEQVQFDADVVFAGGADQDRVPYIAALIKTGFKVALYGGYWERFKETRKYTRGQANPKTLRKAIRGAKVALCLVRRANRDGHCMRTFEVPAIGACMLAEDTEEHREIFGKEGEAVIYFKTIPEMIEKLRWLLEHDNKRQHLAQAAHDLIVNGRNTYKDRLITMLSATGGAL